MTATYFKPMLAGKIEPPFIVSPSRFPVIASPKLDGIRCLIQNGRVYARSLKPMINDYVQELLSNQPLLEGMDGELIVGDPASPNAFNVSGAVTVKGGRPNFVFHVFDLFAEGVPFKTRLANAKGLVEAFNKPYVQLVPHNEVKDIATLHQLEALALELGYEGLMVRDPQGRYKQGRSTANEFGLMKMKRFLDGEGEVLDFVEQFHNNNTATVNELGHTTRSSHKENKVAAGTLGAFVVRNLETGVIHKVSPGKQSAAEVQAIWDSRERFVGKIAKFTYFPTGSVDKPRFSQFVAFRHETDMSAE